MERLAREKISAQQRLAALKKELGVQWDNIDFNNLISEPNPKDERGTIIAPPLQLERNGGSGTTVSKTLLPTEQNGTRQLQPTQADNGIEEINRITATPAIQPAQLSVQLPLQQVVSQGLVVGLHKVALVSKSLPLVSSPVTHIITAPPQLNGKVLFLKFFH